MILQAVKTGDTIFVGHYLFTGSETTSVWLEVGPQETNCKTDIINEFLGIEIWIICFQVDYKYCHYIFELHFIPV